MSHSCCGAQISPEPCFAKDSCMLLVRFNGLFQAVMVSVVWNVLVRSDKHKNLQ